MANEIAYRGKRNAILNNQPRPSCSPLCSAFRVLLLSSVLVKRLRLLKLDLKDNSSTTTTKLAAVYFRSSKRKIELRVYIHLTSRFHVAVRLFSNRSQMTSKCGKNKEVALDECVTDVLYTTF